MHPASAEDSMFLKEIVQWIIPIGFALVAIFSWIASAISDKKLNKHNDSDEAHAALLLRIDEKLAAIGREDERAHRDLTEGVNGLRDDVGKLVDELAGRRSAHLGGRDYNDRTDR